jgi:glutathione S-transferase
MQPILYSFRRCPYAIRARMTLAYSKISCELREVKLQAKPQALLEASSKATVPVLQLADRVIDESLDIMHWALARHDPDHWLPPDPATLTAQQDLISQCEEHFKPLLDRYKYADRYPECSALEHRRNASKFPAHLDAQLKQRFLFGDKPGIADIAVFPFIRQFAFVDIAWFEQAPWPALHGWLNSLLTSDLFTGVMTKYPPWQPGDPITRFPACSPAEDH